nr:reverse transcriptase domain-containing protein [Tanacetum cinerariifolium]
MADRTMEELLQAPTEGYGEAIVILEILAENFEIKTNLLQLVQANKFHGRENDNPHSHISNFKRMTATLKYRNVPNDAIKLMLFPYSLEDRARIWYEKEPPNSILKWEDLGETEYTNSQDILSWLSHATPGEERNHGPQNGTHLPTQPENLSATVPETAPDLIPEVSNSNTNSETGSFFETPDHTGQSENTHEQEMVAVKIVSKGYVLPPRSNQEVPPKIYSPKKESRRCKYPVANIAEGNLSKGAKALSRHYIPMKSPPQ